MAVKTKKKRNAPALSRGDLSLLNYLLRLSGAPQTDQQIEAEASSGIRRQTDPILAEIRRSNQQATTAGQADIRRTTAGYVSTMRGVAPQVRKDYDASIAQNDQEGAALRAFLGDQGAAASKGLADKAAAIGAPKEAVDASAGAVAGMQKGAAGAQAANTYAQGSDYIGNRAAAASYADMLPGFAAGEGAESEGRFTSAQAASLADRLGAVESQVPGAAAELENSIRGREADRRSNRANLAAGFLSNTFDRRTQARIAEAGLGKDYALGASNAAIDYTNALGYRTDANGNPITDADGNLIPTASTVAAAGKEQVKSTKARQTALSNRAAAETTAQKAVRTLAANATKATYAQKEEPILLRRDAKGQPIYKAAAGGVTRDPRAAATHTVKTPNAKPAFNELVRRAMALEEVRQLGARYALKPAEVRQLVVAALRASGVAAPASKPMGPGMGVGLPKSKRS